MRPPFQRVVFAPLAFALVLAGCAGSDSSPRGSASSSAATEGAMTASAAGVSTAPTTEATETTEPGEENGLTVDLRVVSGPGGVFAFAKVFIRGEGPFAFTVDTGASRSVLDWDVVKRVGVKTIGEPVEITGITCRGEAGVVRVQGWRAGGVRLPSATIQTVDMPEPPDGTEIDGLLGSDVLSQFGTITVDYTAERLLLRRGAA